MSANRARAAFAAALMAGLAIMLGACGQAGSGTSNQSVADSGVNASLSNEDLISVAITNMMALDSYWVDFEGLQPPRSTTPTAHMTMNGYELVGKAMKLTVTGQSTTDFDTTLKSWTILDALSASLSPSREPSTRSLPWRVDAILMGDSAYFSGDGGKTWHQPQGGWDMSGMVVSFACVWNPEAWGPGHGDSAWYGADVYFYETSFSDAEPKTEVIAGVPTRHLTTNLLVVPKEYASLDYPRLLNYGPKLAMDLRNMEAATLDVWVSTDATPRIVRTRYDIAVLPAKPDNQSEPTLIPYSLTWSWSRFNEQFPSIVAPGGAPTETPIPPEPTATLVPTSEPPAAGMPRTGSSAASGEADVALSMIGGLLLAGLLLRKTRA